MDDAPYKVIDDYNLTGLMDSVNKALGDGWRLRGELVVTCFRTAASHHYFQVVVKS